ncbi:MAG TPA: hypothetical protein VK789_20255 [Bryobacteraceae bacterium]|jgi:hypothetical protein|nr:hypothetical protein [Bryobacteraceae bacterium]
MNDTLNPPPAPTRVYYSTGRMLGVEDFQADQDYHRGRLARILMQMLGSGTVTGMLVQTDANPDPTKLEIQVTAGMAIDRAGRIIEVPRTVCIVLNNWLTQYVTAWQAQQSGGSVGTTAIADPNTAIHDGANLMVDVFATFIPCTQGVTPCFASQDDYDATDAFQPNRLLDSFAMQLVLRTDATPKTPLDPWAGLGTQQPPVTTVRQAILSGTLAPSGALAEYPPNFDRTAVFLARILVPATAGTGGNPPTWNLTGFSNSHIDNTTRLFLVPVPVLTRWDGLGSGTES